MGQQVLQLKMNKTLLVFSLFFTSILKLNSQLVNYNELNNLEFYSEYALYDSSFSYIFLSTDVLINNLKDNDVKLQIKSNEAIINLSSSTITLNSNFTIETSSMVLTGNKGEFNFKDEEGNFYNPISKYDRFIIKAKEVKIKKTKYSYKNAFFTTCDHTPPHYHISSQGLVLVPKDYILSYNNIFFIGKIPVFYFPLIYKPLGQGTPILSQFYPGYDGRNGFYIKSNLTYKFSSYTKLKLFVDYFSRKGFGFGSEVYKYKSESIKFNISYYRIDEKGNGKIEWGENGGIWAKLHSTESGNLYLQSYLRLLSSPYFNNNYFRSNPFAISDDKQWQTTLTYQMPYSYLRLTKGAYYIKDGDYNFKETQNISPKIEYQRFTGKLFNSPINHTIYLSFENSKVNSLYFQKKLYTDYTLSNSIILFKKFSFNNSFDYIGEYYLNNDADDILKSHYKYNSSFKYSTLNNSYELKYTGVFRTEKNKMSIDSKSSDKGVETSLLNLDITFFSEIARYLRVNASYDLKPYQQKKGFDERLMDFSIDYYRNFQNSEIYLSEIYNIKDGHKGFIAQLNSNYEKNYLNIGFSNYSNNKDRFLISNVLGYYPSKTGGWYGEFILRYYIDFDRDMGVKIFEKGININKEFHDFRTKFTYRNRKNVNEIFFYITLKMNDKYRKNEIDRKVDEYFKPWRRFDEERDY